MGKLPFLSQEQPRSICVDDQSTQFGMYGIAHVLERHRLRVPLHQRDFAWTTEEVSELLNDIQGAIDEDQSEYFLGAVVLLAADDRLEVLDGQQRLATVSLLLADIARRYDALSDVQAASTVRNRYLANFDLEESEELPQLLLNQTDEPYFRKLVSASPSPPAVGAPSSHRRMQAALHTVQAWLDVKLDPNSTKEPVKWLGRFTTYMHKRASVLELVTPSDANAYLLFETLNDRGLDLTTADLLKNHLLGRSHDHFDVVLDRWRLAQSRFFDDGERGQFITFLRHYWSSRHDVVRERDLYRTIRSEVVSKQQARDFAVSLEAASYFYEAMTSADHEHWNGNPEARDSVRTLTLLGVEQYRPLLLAVLEVLPKIAPKLLASLVRWNVRLLVAGGGRVGGGVLERRYSEVARQIRSGDLKTLASIEAAVRKFVPRDQEFKEAFATLTVTKAPMAKYYLRELNQRALMDSAGKGKKAQMEVEPSQSLTLEHVLPKVPGDNWKQFNADQHAQYVHRLGNLALLTSDDNGAAQSEPFVAKKALLAKSTLPLTAHLQQEDDWTPERVVARQVGLAELAVKIW